MAVLAQQVIVGTIGNVYELRTVGNENRKVIEFSVAVTKRKRDGEEWKDGDTYWINVTAWNFLAENIAKSFKQGDRVFVYGSTDMKPGYTKETEDGEKEMPPRAFLTAEFAGHETTYAQTAQKRKSAGENNSNSRKSNNTTAKKAAPKKKVAPPKDEIDFDDDNDFDFDDEIDF